MIAVVNCRSFILIIETWTKKITDFIEKRVTTASNAIIY